MTTLAEAREAALANRRIARKGGDPLAPRKAAAVPTFEEAALAYIEIQRPAWSNRKHAGQWTATLESYAFPRLGKRPVDAIDAADMLAVLKPIWHEKPETARRVRQRIGAVLKSAMALGHRADNPAGDALNAPKRNSGAKQHHRALPHREVAAAVEAVRASRAGTAVKLAVEFLILTAARSGAVRRATWAEIDGAT